MTRKIWDNLTVVQKIDHFKEKYLSKDEDLLYNIRMFIIGERFHDEPQLLDDRIVYYESVDLDKFAEMWTSMCDENLNVIVHYDLLSEEDIEMSIAYGNDFIINHKIDYSIKNYEDILTLYGEKSIYYHEWGPYPNYKDEDIHDDFFVCACTKTKGKSNMNTVCHSCGQPVVQRDFSVDKFGYFKLPVRFITGQGYLVLSKILNGVGNEGVLEYICGKRLAKDTTSAKRQFNLAKKYKDKFLYDCVEDLIYECLGGKKIENKKYLIDFFLNNKDKFFLHYIPVISTAFRRMSYSTSFGVEHLEAHNDLNHVLTSLAHALMNLDLYMGTRSVYKYYYLATKYIKEMFTSIFALAAHKKSSYLRNCVMGLRQNNVVMAVIEPLDRGMREDICVINYRYYLALYSQEIENFLIYDKKMAPHKVHLILNYNTDLTKDEKELVHEYMDKHTSIVEYNRQPTIRMQSSIPLLVVGLTDAPIMYIHPATCGKVNADHDKITVTFTVINRRCYNTENCWNALKPISPAGSRKSEDKYIG